MNITRMCHMLAAHAVTIAALTSDLSEAEASVPYIEGAWTFKQVWGICTMKNNTIFVRVFFKQ